MKREFELEPQLDNGEDVRQVASDWNAVLRPGRLHRVPGVPLCWTLYRRRIVGD